MILMGKVKDFSLSATKKAAFWKDSFS